MAQPLMVMVPSMVMMPMMVMDPLTVCVPHPEDSGLVENHCSQHLPHLSEMGSQYCSTHHWTSRWHPVAVLSIVLFSTCRQQVSWCLSGQNCLQWGWGTPHPQKALWLSWLSFSPSPNTLPSLTCSFPDTSKSPPTLWFCLQCSLIISSYHPTSPFMPPGCMVATDLTHWLRRSWSPFSFAGGSSSGFLCRTASCHLRHAWQLSRNTIIHVFSKLTSPNSCTLSLSHQSMGCCCRQIQSCLCNTDTFCGWLTSLCTCNLRSSELSCKHHVCLQHH